MKEKKVEVLFEANTCQCRINANGDRSAITRGEADFVTAFVDNQDFRCIAKDGVLTITPANGCSFVKTLPQNSNGPVVGGLFDHTKFIAYGPEIVPVSDGSTNCTTWIANVRQFHVDVNPYGSEIKNPQTDIRLASAGLLMSDLEHLLVFDFIISNEIAYAIIERLPGLEAVFGNYAAYSYAIPVLESKNLKSNFYEYKICYNRSENTINWYIGNVNVLRYNAPGKRVTPTNTKVIDYKSCQLVPIENPTRFLLNNHGGVEPVTPIVINSYQTGIALFTLLDWYRPNNLTGEENKALVRLESNRFRNITFGPFYYTNPQSTSESKFLYDCSLAPGGLFYQACIPPNLRIFGQGAILKLSEFKNTLIKN